MSPVPGALTDFMKSMLELTNEKMPDVVVHEYAPLLDSSDMGPPDWQVIARDIKANYLHFDGFVILMGTDTMAYTASELCDSYVCFAGPTMQLIAFVGQRL